MTMGYTPEGVQKLLREYPLAIGRFDDAILKLLSLTQLLKVEDARTYLNEGVGRRMMMIKHSIQEVYRIYPPDRQEPLIHEFMGVTVLLQAHFMNLYGLFDNLCWVLTHEKALLGTPTGKKKNTFGRKDIGLYSEAMQQHLSPELRDYLASPRIAAWHDKHLKDFRDALAHRLPLYVPPYAHNLLTNAKSACPLFAQSLTMPDPVWIHSQVFADLNTAEAIVRIFSKFDLEKQFAPAVP